MVNYEDSILHRMYSERKDRLDKLFCTLILKCKEILDGANFVLFLEHILVLFQIL